MRIVFFIGILLITGYLSAQQKATVSGSVKDAIDKRALPFVNVVVLKETDSSFIAGTISTDNGIFSLPDISAGSYFIKITHTGYNIKWEKLMVGQLSSFLDLGSLELQPDSQALSAVTVIAKQDPVSQKMDKKTFNLADNFSQAGGSALDGTRCSQI